MVIVKLRRCQRCKSERLVPDQIAYNQRTCRRCARRHWKRLHGVKRPCHGCGSLRKRAPRSAYCDRCRMTPKEYRAAASRRYYAKVKADPVRWAAFLEDKRIDSRLRRERQGLPVRELSSESYARRYGSGKGFGPYGNIDARPLTRAINEWLDEERTSIGTAAMGLHTIIGLARLAHVTERTLRRLLEGQDQCALNVADRIAIAIGSHLDVIYPDAPGVLGRSEALEAA